MYSTGFVVSVKNNKGEVLRESKNKEVFLKFDSEYSILIKNTNMKNAFAKIEIDGTDIMNGNVIFVPQYDSVTIERFCIDGDLNNGKKLKFVSSTDSNVQNPTSEKLGELKVTLWNEVKNGWFKKYKPDTNPLWPNPYVPNPLWPTKPYVTYSNDSTYSTNTYDDSSIDYYSVNTYDGSSVGATIEGSSSSQKFSKIEDKDIEDEIAGQIVIHLKPIKSKSITVKDTKNIFCTNCGTKNRFKNNYCFFCGTKIIK